MSYCQWAKKAFYLKNKSQHRNRNTENTSASIAFEILLKGTGQGRHQSTWSGRATNFDREALDLNHFAISQKQTNRQTKQNKEGLTHHEPASVITITVQHAHMKIVQQVSSVTFVSKRRIFMRGRQLPRVWLSWAHALQNQLSYC